MLEVSLMLAFIALAIATITDIKKKEVPDWLSYSFIASAIAIALSETIIFQDFTFILKSLSGLAVFFILANLFYYGRLFAGGDAKLLMGIGASMSLDFSFLLNTLVIGGLYGLVYSMTLAIINFKKVKQEIKKVKLPIAVFAAIFLISVFSALLFSPIFYFIAVLSFFLPLIYAFTLTVEKVALIKKVDWDKITEGDWLAKDVKIGKKLIKANFEGLTKSQIKIIQKARKKILIKYGLPFVPVFLIAFILELIIGNLFLILV